MSLEVQIRNTFSPPQSGPKIVHFWNTKTNNHLKKAFFDRNEYHLFLEKNNAIGCHPATQKPPNITISDLFTDIHNGQTYVLDYSF